VKNFVDYLISWGPWGVLILAILDSAGIPLPAGVDALVTVVAALEPGRAYFAASLATVGSLAGCMFLYYLARKGGERYLDRHTATGRGRKLRGWFMRYGMITVFIPALLPIPLPLKVFILSAGALGVKPWTFAGVVLAARIPRYFGLAWLGAKLGYNSAAWLKDHSKELLLAAALLAAALFLLVKLAGRRRAATSV